jgi:hypothetical protein
MAEKFPEIIREFQPDFQAIREMNPSENNFPYHNSAHMLSTAVRAAAIFDAIHPRNLARGNLVMAALLHDADYAGAPDDEINIARAVAFAKRFLSARTDFDISEIEKLIRATQFPHKHTAEIGEMIIQDADLLQTVPGASEDYRVWLERLSRETGKAASADFVKVEMLNTDFARNLLLKSQGNV